jgi:hypothetical protein
MFLLHAVYILLVNIIIWYVQNRLAAEEYYLLTHKAMWYAGSPSGSKCKPSGKQKWASGNR